MGFYQPFHSPQIFFFWRLRRHKLSRGRANPPPPPRVHPPPLRPNASLPQITERLQEGGGQEHVPSAPMAPGAIARFRDSARLA